VFDAIYVQNEYISMKKLLFQKFLKDTFKFFIIICFAISIIVWVIQAVGYLDFVTEDGHSFSVYFSYTLLNFPKFFHRILPFAFFVSLFFQISQYELNNELLIFWNNGINKIKFINVVILYSIILLLFQIFLGSYVSPLSQNKARSFIRGSNIDFFPSLIKAGKFIDAVSDLTIFIESKDESGLYKNIFLNDYLSGDMKNENQESQTIYAKKGILINKERQRYFELYDGKMLNIKNGKITNFTFEKIEFNLAKYDSKTISYPKIQEAPSLDLYNCLYYNYKKRINEFKANFLRCEPNSIKNIKQEFLKRHFKPIYFPLLALITSLLIVRSKENKNYNLFRLSLFVIVFLLMVVSEVLLRYSTYYEMGPIFFILFPILSFLIIYTVLITKFNNRI
jgi:lipopolysaccharide export system permease protein